MGSIFGVCSYCEAQDQSLEDIAGEGGGCKHLDRAQKIRPDTITVVQGEADQEPRVLFLRRPHLLNSLLQFLCPLKPVSFPVPPLTSTSTLTTHLCDGLLDVVVGPDHCTGCRGSRSPPLVSSALTPQCGEGLPRRDVLLGGGPAHTREGELSGGFPNWEEAVR